jgi:hypothetical protein
MYKTWLLTILCIISLLLTSCSWNKEANEDSDWIDNVNYWVDYEQEWSSFMWDWEPLKEEWSRDINN